MKKNKKKNRISFDGRDFLIIILVVMVTVMLAELSRTGIFSTATQWIAMLLLLIMIIAIVCRYSKIRHEAEYYRCMAERLSNISKWHKTGDEYPPDNMLCLVACVSNNKIHYYISRRVIDKESGRYIWILPKKAGVVVPLYWKSITSPMP